MRRRLDSGCASRTDFLNIGKNACNSVVFKLLVNRTMPAGSHVPFSVTRISLCRLKAPELAGDTEFLCDCIEDSDQTARMCKLVWFVDDHSYDFGVFYRASAHKASTPTFMRRCWIEAHPMPVHWRKCG